MGITMPITKGRIRNHFHYNLWKYAVLIGLSLLFWNLLFTTTHYRTPDHLKVELYAEGFQTSETTAAMDELMDKIHGEIMPQMEEVTCTYLLLDGTYGPVQLTVWASAGQGDVYLLAKENFLQMARAGALLDLQPYIDKGFLQVNGISLAAGVVRDEQSGEWIQRGISTDTLAGLADYGLLTQGGFLSILASTENEEESVRLMDYLLTHMQGGETR